MSYLSRAYYKVFAWRCHFLTFFVTIFISPIHGHNSENNWLRPCPLNQNFMKNSNLKFNERYEVHNDVKTNIFNDFGAVFSHSHTHQITFFYVPTISYMQTHLYTNQFFVLFHLAGVSCLALDGIINFWHHLGVQLQKMTKKWLKMLNNTIFNCPYLNFNSKFKNFMKFWFRKHFLYPAFTIRRPVKGMLKIFSEMPEKRPFSLTPPHCTWAPQRMCSKYDQIWSWLDPMDV